MTQVIILTSTNEYMLEDQVNAVLKDLGDSVIDIQYRPIFNRTNCKYSVMIVCKEK